MPPKREDDGEPLERVHLMLFEKDVARLQRYFAPNVGMSKAVRVIVRDYLDRFDQKVDSKMEEQG